MTLVVTGAINMMKMMIQPKQIIFPDTLQFLKMFYFDGFFPYSCLGIYVLGYGQRGSKWMTLVVTGALNMLKMMIQPPKNHFLFTLLVSKIIYFDGFVPYICLGICVLDYDQRGTQNDDIHCHISTQYAYHTPKQLFWGVLLYQKTRKNAKKM